MLSAYVVGASRVVKVSSVLSTQQGENTVILTSEIIFISTQKQEQEKNSLAQRKPYFSSSILDMYCFRRSSLVVGMNSYEHKERKSSTNFIKLKVDLRKVPKL